MQVCFKPFHLVRRYNPHSPPQQNIYYGGVTVLNNDGTATATTANELPPMVRWREALHRRGWEEEEVRSRCGALCPLRLFVSEKREVYTGYYVYRTCTLFIMSLSLLATQETALPLLSFTFLTKVDRSKMGM